MDTAMKRLIGLIGLILVMLTTANAQFERIGAGLTFSDDLPFDGGETGNPGANIKAWFYLDRDRIFHIVPSVSAYAPHEFSHSTYTTTDYMFQGDLDFQAAVAQNRSLKLVGMAGVNYSYLMSKHDVILPGVPLPADSTTWGIGPSLGVAVEARISGSWDFIVSAKYAFTGLRGGDKSKDEWFLVAPLRTPIIQVHGVYYLKARSRGYYRR